MGDLLPCPFCGEVPDVYCRKSNQSHLGWIATFSPMSCEHAFPSSNAFFGDGCSEEEAIEDLASQWNDRVELTTRRIIKGDDDEGTHYAWCEAGDHAMNPTGEYCIHCGRRVIE